MLIRLCRVLTHTLGGAHWYSVISQKNDIQTRYHVVNFALVEVKA